MSKAKQLAARVARLEASTPAKWVLDFGAMPIEDVIAIARGDSRPLRPLWTEANYQSAMRKVEAGAELEDLSQGELVALTCGAPPWGE